MVFLSCAAGPLVKTYEVASESMALHRAMGSLNAEVTCARYNHNGKIVASCSVDGGICLDVAATGELLSRFFYVPTATTDRRVNSISFSSGSRFLASGGGDGHVQVWDLKSQEVSQTYNISASAVTSVAFSGYKDDYIVAGSASGAISVCDVQSAETVGFLSVDPKQFPVSGVTNVLSSPHPYARQIVGSTYSDGSIRVWDLQTGQLTTEFAQQHDAAATCLAISPVSKVLLASGGHDGRVLFFDTLQRKELRSINFEHRVSALALCADGKTLAVGTANGEVAIFDLRGEITPLFTTTVHDSAPVNALHFASPSTAASSSAGEVAPYGQPVISTERTTSPPSSPSRSAIIHDIATNKIQSGRMKGSPQKPVSHAVLSKSLPSCQFDIDQDINSNPLSEAQNVAPRIDGARFGEDRTSPVKPNDRLHSEPSLLSLLADSPPRSPPQSTLPLHSLNPGVTCGASPSSDAAAAMPLPLTPPLRASPLPEFRSTDRLVLRQHGEQLRQEMAHHYQQQQSRVHELMEYLLAKYDVVLAENQNLRRENETLRAYIESTSNQ